MAFSLWAGISHHPLRPGGQLPFEASSSARPQSPHTEQQQDLNSGRGEALPAEGVPPGFGRRYG